MTTDQLPAGARPALPELAAVQWRPRASERSLRTRGRLWTAWTVAIGVQFAITAAALLVLEPLTAPVGAGCLAYGWVIGELYAGRGAGALRRGRGGDGASERRAQGLLGDLLGHGPRELHRDTGLALERGRLGTWLLGEGGALLVTPGGHRVHCFCVAVRERELPPSDRVAHLLLSLRTDEAGFATVANHVFSGAPWRVSRRLPAERRPALAAAVRAARA